MAGDKYRITSPTIALFLEDGRHVAHMIPKDTIITVQTETFNGDRLRSPVGWENGHDVYAGHPITRGKDRL